MECVDLTTDPPTITIVPIPQPEVIDLTEDVNHFLQQEMEEVLNEEEEEISRLTDESEELESVSTDTFPMAFEVDNQIALQIGHTAEMGHIQASFVPQPHLIQLFLEAGWSLERTPANIQFEKDILRWAIRHETTSQFLEIDRELRFYLNRLRNNEY